MINKENFLPNGTVTNKSLIGGFSLEKWLKKTLKNWGVPFVDPCCSIGNNPGSGGTSGAADFSTLQSFASNTAARAALGAGKLYKSTTLINGSPIILITV